ncbi:DNA cytosine methyltransferase [Nocardia sp. NPDC051321]|uniref:DNA cytosine methyltransferase n=1 Tax=Nocardia sp. NPDC051321 TaxID=3364323 RepID=UPI0037A67E91
MTSRSQKARTSVELFAGAGGLAMAVESAGFRPLLFNEFAKRACETLAINNKATAFEAAERPDVPGPRERTPLIVGDVDKVDFHYLKRHNVDVLAGGPPCQPFSLGGTAKGDEDDRNGFPHMFRAITEMSPKAVICENVRGLLRPSFKPYFDYIKRELSLPFEKRADGANWRDHDQILRDKLAMSPPPDETQYDVKHYEVNAADYGVPQIRNRVIIIAFRRDLGVSFDRFEELIEPQYSEESLYEDMRPKGPYWDRHSEVPTDVRERVIARLPPRTLLSPDEDRKLPWRTLRDALKGIELKGIDENQGPLPAILSQHLDRLDRKLGGFTDHVGWPDARIYRGHTPNELDRPAKTVKAGVHGVPGGESVMLLDDGTHRYMTVRETARVMTFPDHWQLAGPRGEKMRQLGNAVPVLLGQAFALAVATALKEAESAR